MLKILNNTSAVIRIVAAPLVMVEGFWKLQVSGDVKVLAFQGHRTLSHEYSSDTSVSEAKR
ncbi:hypothetical protein E2C01_060143 [Portunus trituberculatus]|uniref:Uncharacterized protein n=1 Tax=Portunus trituberculatus TaxID=210409 RepID=A0A5B7H1F4_PORTR|nr:hypothetical protein [Portunus trituberculatus]